MSTQEPISGILVVGDSYLDVQLNGRLAGYAGGAPSLEGGERVLAPGGAACIAAAISHLGIPTFLALVTGDDRPGVELTEQCQRHGVTVARHVTSTPTSTVHKISMSKRVLAVQEHVVLPPYRGAEIREKIRGLLADPRVRLRSIVVVDRNRGSVDADFLGFVNAVAAEQSLAVLAIVDGPVHLYHRQVSVLVTTLNGAMAFLGERSVHPGLNSLNPEDWSRVAARELRDQLKCWGAAVLGENTAAIEIPTQGAAITPAEGRFEDFAAGLAVACGHFLTADVVLKFATTAADMADRFGRFATAVDVARRQREFGSAGKIVHESAIYDELRQVKEDGGRIAVVDGCFDGLHAGHMTLFVRAHELAELVIVAAASDTAICRKKGRAQPRIPDKQRYQALASLDTVDLVVPYDGDSAALVRRLRPDVLVKGRRLLAGGDIPGADAAADYGAAVEFVPDVDIGP